MNTPQIATPVRYFLTRETPAEAEAAEKKYWAQAHAQEAATVRAREVGIPALKRLFELVETRDSGRSAEVPGLHGKSRWFHRMAIFVTQRPF